MTRRTGKVLSLVLVVAVLCAGGWWWKTRAAEPPLPTKMTLMEAMTVQRGIARIGEARAQCGQLMAHAGPSVTAMLPILGNYHLTLEALAPERGNPTALVEDDGTIRRASDSQPPAPPAPKK